VRLESEGWVHLAQNREHLCVLVNMAIKLIPFFIQLMHKNYYKIVKKLKSFKIIIVAPTCFGLHKPSSGSSQPVHAATIPKNSNNDM